jgi:hypothetical protein
MLRCAGAGEEFGADLSGAMKHLSGMSNISLTLVLCTLVRGGEVFAADAPMNADSNAKADEINAHGASQPAAMILSDPVLLARQFSAPAPLSTSAFRPRPAAQSESQMSRGGFMMDEHLMGTTTVWQQLSQFRSEDRVRLLTIWQTRASSVSLQADKHGGPSLQWSSPWMIRGRSSNGLLDRLFNVPSRGIASRISGAKGTPAPSPLKPAEATASTKSN